MLGVSKDLLFVGSAVWAESVASWNIKDEAVLKDQLSFEGNNISENLEAKKSKKALRAPEIALKLQKRALKAQKEGVYALDLIAWVWWN